jgi:hypothetical protein
MTNEAELLKALQHGYSGYIGNGHLMFEDLPQYAQQLKQDLDWIGLESFQILPPQTLPVQVDELDGTVPVSEYIFGETRNNVDHAHPEEEKTKLLSVKNTEGTGLNREDLRWVCDVFRMARELLPTLWLQDGELRNLLAIRHLNTVNELFWLGRWKCFFPEQTIRERQLDPNCGKTVDWSLAVTSPTTDASVECRINLEVKNLTTSVESFLFQGHRDTSQFVENAIRGLARKFPDTCTQDLNVVCFSTFVNSSLELQQLASRVLDEFRGVDCVAVWILTADDGQNWFLLHRQFAEDQAFKVQTIKDHFQPPGYREAKPLLYTHPAWGILPWQQD